MKNTKEGRKTTKSKKKKRGNNNQKTQNKMSEIHPNILVSTINVTGLNLAIKRLRLKKSQRLPERIFKKSTLCHFYLQYSNQTQNNI